MRVNRIDLFHVSMPLISPWRTAYGEDTAIESVLCRMSSGSIDAWGESTPLAAPTYSPEWAGGVFAASRDWLAPAIVGQEIASGSDLQRHLRRFKGNSFAKATLDTAWWALHSKLIGLPLHEALGATRGEVVVGADFGVADTIDDLLREVGEAVDDGYPRIKLKYRPGWDLSVLRSVRDEHPAHDFHIDCNGGYTLDDLDMFHAIDEFGLTMIEQPLRHDDLHDHAILQSKIETAVCLDESVKNVQHARHAVTLGSCRYVNIKPGRVGGLTNALLIHDLCRSAGIPCWVGGMLESSVGSAICTSLAMLDNFTYPPDIFPSGRFYAEDLSDPPLVLGRSANGTPLAQAFDTLPEPVEARLKALTVQHATVAAP